jgi:DNA-binding response OmpR family regulator
MSLDCNFESFLSPNSIRIDQNTNKDLNNMQELELLDEPQAEVAPSPSLGTILIVEDDQRMQRVLRRIFTEERYTAVVAPDGHAALELFRRERPLAVLLDLILPDYVTKPFSPRELTARVYAAIRRQRKTSLPTVYRFSDCEIDFEKMTVHRSGKPVVLTAHEFKLLKFFTEKAERVLTRYALLNEVWGYNSYPTTRTVDNQILKLRQKLEPDPANPKHLLTIYGAGYKFVP